MIKRVGLMSDSRCEEATSRGISFAKPLHNSLPMAQTVQTARNLQELESKLLRKGLYREYIGDYCRGYEGGY